VDLASTGRDKALSDLHTLVYLLTCFHSVLHGSLIVIFHLGPESTLEPNGTAVLPRDRTYCGQARGAGPPCPSTRI